MITVAALALVAMAPSVHVDAPPALREAVIAAMARERPALVVVETATAAALRVGLRAGGDALELTLGEGQAAAETRALGALDGEGAALRRAVLLIVQRFDEVEASAARAPARERPPDAPAADRPAPPARPHAPPSMEADWRFELGPSVGVWSGARVGLAVGASRALGPLQLGARALVRGLCCAVSGDHVEADAWLVGGLAEGAWRGAIGPLGVAGVVGAGAAYERLDAVAVDVFVGRAGSEPFEAWSLLVRPALRLDVDLTPRVRLALSGGAEVHGGGLAIRLPAAFAAGRAPLERPLVTPFFELTLGVGG